MSSSAIYQQGGMQVAACQNTVRSICTCHEGHLKASLGLVRAEITFP